MKEAVKLMDFIPFSSVLIILNLSLHLGLTRQSDNCLPITE